MRPNRDFRSASKEQYKKFIEENPNIQIDFKTFENIIRKWNTAVVNYIIETGDSIKLPYGFGTISVVKYKRRNFKINKKGEQIINKRINWIETKKHGKYIYHINQITDGYSFYFFWTPKLARFKFSTCYSLSMARKHSRLLSKLLQVPNNKYQDLYIKKPIYRS